LNNFANFVAKKAIFVNHLAPLRKPGNGYTTLWRDHFCAARFVVALFGIAHFVAGPFWCGPFWREFYENNFFLLLFVSIYFSFFNL